MTTENYIWALRPIKVLVLSIFLVSVSLATTVAVAAEHPLEREALTALYDSTNGAGWSDNSGWGTTGHYCNWFGIICNAENHVIKLDLTDNSLSGPIPAQLGNLGSLEWFSLSFNNLSGSIPDRLGDLRNLEELYLVSSNLTGSIPHELGNLSDLELLALPYNNLTGTIPTQLGNLSTILELDLRDNSLSGSIPTQLGNLSSLGQLRLDSNNLTGPIPVELSSLSNLEALGLAHNDLSGPIPAELESLINLHWLLLDNNPRLACWETENALAWAQGLSLYLGPATVCSTNHVSLMALFNNTHGENWIDNTSWGTMVDPCQETSWHGVSCDNGGVSALVLNSNNLSGSIPAELGKLTSLMGIDLQDNNLGGPIPAELVNLKSLNYLRLASNPLFCWKTQEAVDWALGLADYTGPKIACSFVHLPHLMKQ